MNPSGIIGAAVGCGLALISILAFIFFRYKTRHKSADGNKCDEIVSSRWMQEGISEASKTSKSGLSSAFVQPTDARTDHLCREVFVDTSSRRTSTATCVSYSSSLFSDGISIAQDAGTIGISLHYRVYYDVDNSQLILHILKGCFSDADNLEEKERLRLEGAALNPASFASFHISGLENERRCGQTKIYPSENRTANYDEIFSVPLDVSCLSERRLHFEIHQCSNDLKPRLLGFADVALEETRLDNGDQCVELIPFWPVTRNEGVPRGIMPTPARPELLVFLSYHTTQEHLKIDILKAKNLCGLFPKYSDLTADLYIKTCLIYDGRKSSKRSKAQLFSLKTNSTTVWNETVVYQLAPKHLETFTLILYFCTTRFQGEAAESILGKGRIGPITTSSTNTQSQFFWPPKGHTQIMRTVAGWVPILRYSGTKQ